MVAYRRNKNLSDKLVTAKLKKLDQTPRGLPEIPKPIIHRCMSKQFYCNICPNKDMSIEYKSTHTGRSYTGVLPYKCGTRNVVYLITCRKCGKQYVGQTYRTYRERIQEHLGYIRRKRMETATGKHFNLPGHTKFDMNHRVISIQRGACQRKQPQTFGDRRKTHRKTEDHGTTWPKW